MKVRALVILVPLLLTGCGSGSSSGPTPLTIHSSFPVPAGQEITMCLTQHLNNPQPFNFSHIESHMAAGSHHTILYTDASNLVPGSTPPQDGIAPCDMGAPRLYVYGAQVPDHSVDMPTGVAGQLPANAVIILEAHYVNATTSNITADVKVELTPMTGTIEYYSGVLFYLDDAFSIPAGAGMNGAPPYSHTTTCGIPSSATVPEINVFRLGTHMHHRGLTSDVDLNSVHQKGPMALYHNTNWEAPVELTYPNGAPLKMTGNDTLSFTCSWWNETSAPIGFGPSAVTDEMCIAAAGYYPRVEGSLALGGVVFCDNGTLYY